MTMSYNRVQTNIRLSSGTPFARPLASMGSASMLRSEMLRAAYDEEQERRMKHSLTPSPLSLVSATEPRKAPQ